MSNPSTTNGQPRPLPPVGSLIKPEQVHKIPNWNDEQRQKYFNGITSLWQTLESHPADSPAYQNAHSKLYSVSNSIKQHMSMVKEAQQNSANQPNGPRPAPSGQQLPQNQQTQHGQPPQLFPPGQNVQTGQPQPQQAPNAPNTAPGNASQRVPYSQKVLDKVRTTNFQVPPHLKAQGQQGLEKHLTDLKKSYANALHAYESNHDRLLTLEKVLQQRQAQGKPLGPSEEQSYQESKRKYEMGREEARTFLERFAEQQRALREAQGQAGGQGNPANEPMTRHTSQNGMLPAHPHQEQQSQPHTVSSALDAAHNQGGTGAMSPSHQGPSHGQPSQTSMTPQAKQPQPSQTQPPQNVKTEPRPQDQTFSSPRPTMPAQNQAEGAAFPLTHEAAMQQARSYSNPNVNTPFPQNVPPSTTHSHPPNSNMHPNNNRENQPSSSAQSKMPIPKEPNWTIPPPQPVSMGQARPTLTNGAHIPGPISQPVITKHPGYVLEGEGERVLSKKKLEELVRQVTGSTGSDTDDGETLTAEVEEVDLNSLLIV